MRHECSNCKHFTTEVMMGDKPLEAIGDCRALGRRDIEADDYCPHYEIARWAKAEEESEVAE